MMECEVVREAPINSHRVNSHRVNSHRVNPHRVNSHRACFARYQRGGCGQIGRSLASPDWPRNSGYDLRRTRRDFTDLTRNAAHGGMNQCFPKHVCWF